MRRVCVVTGTRAEYGLLYWFMKEVVADEELELQVVVTGAHLSPEFGLTFNHIIEDGFSINERIEILLSSDTAIGICKSLALGTIGFAEAFARLKPDIIVLLGDRYEVLAAAQAALISKIPIAHIHGGELTEGAFDDAIRHSITKMAYLHFVAADPYRKRVIQLGEDPNRVFTVGALGLENIRRLELMSKQELEAELNFTFGELCFLVTYHPETLCKNSSIDSLRALLDAFDTMPQAKMIFTMPNSDTEGRAISRLLEEYVDANQERCMLVTSLGQLKYLSALKHVDLVIGNSSSGIYEAPFVRTPTVNIGERQRGRLRTQSVIDCKGDKKSILAAIQRALSKEVFETLCTESCIFGAGNASLLIKQVVKSVNLKEVAKKSFYDLEVKCD